MHGILATAKDGPGAGLAARLFLTLLEPKLFAGELFQGASWKDIGAGPRHGEYTHRIQWYCIHKTFHWNAAPLFMALGGIESVKSADEEGLWDFLFDQERFEVKTDLDCRCPEYFHQRLQNDEQNLPTLSAWLRATTIKRRIQGIPEPVAGEHGLGDSVRHYWDNKKQALGPSHLAHAKRLNKLT